MTDTTIDTNNALIERLEMWADQQKRPPTVQELADVLIEGSKSDNAVIVLSDGSVDASGHLQDVDDAAGALRTLGAKVDFTACALGREKDICESLTAENEALLLANTALHEAMDMEKGDLAIQVVDLEAQLEQHQWHRVEDTPRPTDEGVWLEVCHKNNRGEWYYEHRQTLTAGWQGWTRWRYSTPPTPEE